jgi:hypothetical protein
MDAVLLALLAAYSVAVSGVSRAAIERAALDVAGPPPAAVAAPVARAAAARPHGLKRPLELVTEAALASITLRASRAASAATCYGCGAKVRASHPRPLRARAARRADPARLPLPSPRRARAGALREQLPGPVRRVRSARPRRADVLPQVTV